MTNLEKSKIADSLRQRKSLTGMSDPELATAIGGMSPTLVNHVIKDRWQTESMVSDDKFRKIASWLGVAEEWVIAKDDYNFKRVQLFCRDAQKENASFAISAAPGFCKSEAAKDYAKTHKNVFYIECDQHFTRKDFLTKVIQVMGMPQANETSSEMVNRIVDRLNSLPNPLLIIDEADKLHDKLFQFFITFYNYTYTNCGFLFLGSVFFRLRVLKGVNKNSQGYAEFYSRVGREFQGLQDLTVERVSHICKLNGITEHIDIKRIYNESGNDLRKVKRDIIKTKKVKVIVEKDQLKINIPQ